MAQPDIFDGAEGRDDEAYARWIRGHRDGFVINCHPGRSKADMRVHRASCETIFEERPVGITSTSGQYIKVCASMMADLDLWARKSKGTRPPRCGTCEP